MTEGEESGFNLSSVLCPLSSDWVVIVYNGELLLKVIGSSRTGN